MDFTSSGIVNKQVNILFNEICMNYMFVTRRGVWENKYICLCMRYREKKKGVLQRIRAGVLTLPTWLGVQILVEELFMY